MIKSEHEREVLVSDSVANIHSSKDWGVNSVEGIVAWPEKTPEGSH